MRNRYGEEYNFEKVNDNTFKFIGNTKWCRFGGRENAELDINNLGFFDPSGGPFIEVDYYKIENRLVKRIMSTNDGVLFEVE